MEKNVSIIFDINLLYKRSKQSVIPFVKYNTSHHYRDMSVLMLPFYEGLNDVIICTSDNKGWYIIGYTCNYLTNNENKLVPAFT